MIAVPDRRQAIEAHVFGVQSKLDLATLVG